MSRFRRPLEAKVLITNPSSDELRAMARYEEKTSEYGSAVYVTKVRNRSAKNTYIVAAEGVELGVSQQPISVEKAEELRDKVHEYLKGQEVIQVDRDMGMSPEFRLHCRLYITKPYARIPYMWVNTLFPPADPEGEPDLISIYVPEWPERIIFNHPTERVTYILGTDYFGEAKKSFLRKAMYVAKQRGGLGLHAGSKVLRVRTKDGELKDVGFIMFGLSGTGKTTLTIHDHGLSGEEKAIIRQDDVVFMTPQGKCYGSEDGFFIKTEGLDESQRVLYKAATSPNAIFENVKVYDDGRIDFCNYELTTNGRGIVLRREVEGTDDSIDLEKAHKILFITRRNDVVPIVAKLNAEQGAAFFMLGESVETSAGDPTKAGMPKREVGTNPFIVGPEAEEGNRLLEILRSNPDMECYLINTGKVGARQKDGSDGKKITIKVTTEIMKQIAKGGIEWKEDPDWGYLVPASVDGLDISEYDPRAYFTEEEYRERTERLRKERKDWLAQFPGLAPEILAVVEG